MKTAAYEEGVDAASVAFGIRTAAEPLGRMADGPKHLGASRFVQALENDGKPQPVKEWVGHKRDRPTMWGQAASPEAGGISNQDSALRYNGV